MSPEELDTIGYLPAIRSRQAELKGYRNLRAETKRALFPLVSLGKLGKIDQAPRILETIVEVTAGRFFLDLNPFPGQICGEFASLCNPDGAYQAWRTFARSHVNAIPIALLRDNPPERQFIQQVRRIENDHGVVAIRSRHPAQELTQLQAAMSAVDDVNRMLIILDFGYIRGSIDPKENECLRVITALRSIDAAVRIVTMSSSFPKAVSAYGDSRGSLEIVERDFHWHIGGNQVAVYGDHSAIYPVPFEPTMGRFVPRIDYCLEDKWHYERRRDDDGGYVACARATRELADWDEDFAARCWGAQVIAETASTGTIPAGFGTPASWIAARVNMHIERQHSLSVRRNDDWDEYGEA